MVVFGGADKCAMALNCDVIELFTRCKGLSARNRKATGSYSKPQAAMCRGCVILGEHVDLVHWSDGGYPPKDES